MNQQEEVSWNKVDLEEKDIERMRKRIRKTTRKRMNCGMGSLFSGIFPVWVISSVEWRISSTT